MNKVGQYLRYFFNGRSPGDYDPEMDSGLELTTHYNFELRGKLNLKQYFNYGLNWMTPEEPYHPDYLDVYYSPENVLVEDDLKFYLTKEGRQFPDVYIPWKSGIITSKRAWRFGYFEAEIKLPQGKWGWPAFWMFPPGQWPPEIDIIEGYSGRKGDYSKWFLKNWRLQSNVHTGTTNLDHDSIGGKSHPLPYDITKKYLKYGVLWKEDEIIFFYNRYPVRRISDPKVLDNLKVKTMNIILGTGCVRGKTPDPHIMSVKSVKIWK